MVDGFDEHRLLVDGGELLEQAAVHGTELLKARLAGTGGHAGQLGRELEAVVAGEHLHAAVFTVEHGEGREEVGPPVARGETLRFGTVQADAEEALHRLVHEGGEVDLVAVPDGAGHVVVELLSETTDI